MQGFNLVIFDCDGVLVDSEIIAAQVESRLLTEAGYPIDVSEFGPRFAGLTWKDILLAVEKETQLPLSASLFDKATRLLDERLAREVRPIEGAGAAVALVGEPRCICSNSASHRLKAMLTRVGLHDLFAPRIFSAKDLPDGRPKPAPDIFLHAAREMNADPARTLVVEDSEHGTCGARAAGMRVVGFTGGSHSWPGHADVLTDAGAETVIGHMRDLPATVEALAAWSAPD